MEIRVNKEIMNYRESIVMGLTTRQLVCSVCAVGLAVGVYFLGAKTLGKDITGWLCIVVAAPSAITGFFSFHGMTAEQWAITWLRFWLRRKPRVYQSENTLEIMLEQQSKEDKQYVSSKNR